MGSSFNLSRLRDSIKPFRLHWFSRLRSTNDHAAGLRRRGKLFAPAIVLTGHQLAGRGRGSNTWWSGPGCITVTFILAADERKAPHQVPLLAGLAVRNAAAKLISHPDIQLKWPNDVVCRGKKLAGLLCERVHKADLIGLGLNVNVDLSDAPKALRGHITSLSAICGQPLDMTKVLSTISRYLHQMLRHADEKPFSYLLKEYDRHHALIGRRIRVVNSAHDPAYGGVCEGLDSHGRLLLRDRGKLHHVIAGQVELL